MDFLRLTSSILLSFHCWFSVFASLVLAHLLEIASLVFKGFPSGGFSVALDIQVLQSSVIPSIPGLGPYLFLDGDSDRCSENFYVNVLVFTRGTESIGYDRVCVCMCERFIIGNWLTYYGVWEVWKSVIGKLKIQE